MLTNTIVRKHLHEYIFCNCFEFLSFSRYDIFCNFLKVSIWNQLCLILIFLQMLDEFFKKCLLLMNASFLMHH